MRVEGPASRILQKRRNLWTDANLRRFTNCIETYYVNFVHIKRRFKTQRSSYYL